APAACWIPLTPSPILLALPDSYRSPGACSERSREAAQSYCQVSGPNRRVQYATVPSRSSASTHVPPHSDRAPQSRCSPSAPRQFLLRLDCPRSSSLALDSSVHRWLHVVSPPPRPPSASAPNPRASDAAATTRQIPRSGTCPSPGE